MRSGGLCRGGQDACSTIGSGGALVSTVGVATVRGLWSLDDGLGDELPIVSVGMGGFLLSVQEPVAAGEKMGSRAFLKGVFDGTQSALHEFIVDGRLKRGMIRGRHDVTKLRVAQSFLSVICSSKEG